MAYIEIRSYPDPVLRKVADPVRSVTDLLHRLSEDMLETMYLAHGIGLAANQVGVPVRLVVIDPQTKGRKTPMIIINPEIIASGDEQTDEEGCLSVPGFYEFVKRPKQVHVKGFTIHEEPFEMSCEGRLARAFAHEIDHLDGVLFVDHLSPIKRNLFKKKYLKSGK